MWRNAAIFTAKAGGRCGVFVNEFSEAKGRLILFYEKEASAETRFHFEEFAMSHTKQRSIDGTVELVRFFVCGNCGDPVPDSYVKRLRKRGKTSFECACESMVDLSEPKERLRFPSAVAQMERTADRKRDFEQAVMSARGETVTPRFIEWAGAQRVHLAMVFTDVVGSTAMGVTLLDESMNEVRRDHFQQSRKLIAEYGGYEIKTIGDSFMVVFRSADKALDYALALHARTGHKDVRIRAGIHVGPMSVEENDAFGGTVNFAARVVHEIKGAEIWVSAPAKADLDQLGAERHKKLRWKEHAGMQMKGFPTTATLWELEG